jgi:outer membrane usher protein
LGLFRFPHLFPLLLGIWASPSSGFTIADVSPDSQSTSDPETEVAANAPATSSSAPVFYTRTITTTPQPVEVKPEAPPFIITIYPAKPLASTTQEPKKADRILPVEVVVNGAKGGSWLLLERNGVMYAPFDAFEEWRVQLSPSAQPIDFKLDGQAYWPLSAVPGYKLKMDFSTQTAELQFSPEAFAATRIAQEESRKLAISPILPSAFLNYDLNFSASTPRNSPAVKDLGLLAEIGVSNSQGVLTSSFTGRNLTNNSAVAIPRSEVRLETTFTRDFPNENRTLRLGDAVTRAGTWGRNVYYGGIQYGSNFALTPGFISRPIPALVGVSTAPSTVQMYVNDVLRQTSSVPAGPFTIDNFPLLRNSGDVKMIVRDILGRETVIEQSFFTSPDLLAKGLNDWSVEAGTVRHGMGTASFQYGTGFASGTWRRGYSDTLTLEGRTEISRALSTFGLGVVSVLPRQMLGQASLVISNQQSHPGKLVLLGLEHEGLHNSMSLQLQRASSYFRQLGQDTLTSPVKFQLAGNWNYITDQSDSFGIGFARLNRFDNTSVTTVSGNFSIHLGAHSNLSFNASRAVNGADGTSVGVYFTLPLEGNRLVSATANSHGGQQDVYVSAMQNPDSENNLGWRTLAGHQQGQARVEGGAYYTGRYGKVSGDASASPNQTALRFGANGGVVFADRALFATQRVDQSFAIAEVAGQHNIGVGLGSNELTHTNARGIALIPRLIPYQSNSIRLNPNDLPISAEIDTIEQTATPPWRSAVKVVFPVRGGRAALLKIMLEDGDVAPAGATVQVEGDKEEFYVARRGEVFVTGLSPSNTVRLQWNGQQCKLSVNLPPETPDEIARVGSLLCKGVAR